MSLIRDSLRKIQEKENPADKTIASLVTTAKTSGTSGGLRKVYVLIGVGLLLIVGVYLLLLPATPRRPAQPKPAGEVKDLAGGPTAKSEAGPAAARTAPGVPAGKDGTARKTPPTARVDESTEIRPPLLATLPPSRSALPPRMEEKKTSPLPAGESRETRGQLEAPRGSAAPATVPQVRKDKAAQAGGKAAAPDTGSPTPGRGMEADLQAQENLKKAYEQAYLWQQEGKIELAQAKYREILAQDPHNPYVLTNLGLLYQKTGRLREAVQAYEKALEADPRFVPAIQNLGVIWIKLGNNEEAGRWLERSLALDPDNPAALVNLGILYNKKGNRELARQYWKKSLARDPRLPEVCYNLARLEEESGNIPEAHHYYQQFIRLKNDPHDRLVQDVQRHIRDWRLPAPRS